MESVVIAESGEDANKTAAEITADDEFELFVGDFLEFTAGPQNGTKGMIYYLDDDLIHIRPVGAPHTVIVIPTSVFADENTEIRREPTPLTSFVDIVSLKEGNQVQTFTAKGDPVTVYTVKSVNPEEDNAVFEQDGEETVLHFTVDGRVTGIPRDMDFAVLRSQEGVQPQTQTETETETETVVSNETENEDEIIMYEKQIIEPEEDKDILIIEQKSEDILYGDQEQKNNFIEMERAALDPAKRTNPKYLQRIRRLMENAYQLRNDILEYENSRVVDFKPITYETLATLLQQTEFSLAKPVLNVFKTLYLDHSAEYYNKDDPAEDVSDYKDKEIQIQYLQDAVEGGIAFLEKEFATSLEIGSTKGQLPKLYTVLQPFYNEYFQVIGGLDSNNKKAIKADRDFFRINPLGTAEPTLLGFNPLSNNNIIPLGVDNIEPISMSYMRAIKPRLGKYAEGKTKVVGIVEQGDEAEVWLYVLFPFLFLRDLGVIRSGKLAIDMANSSTRPKTMEMILEEGGGIQDISEKGAILSVDPKGKRAANIELKDWFMGQELYGNGIGDLLPYLRSIGLDSAEFTPEQQEILLKKIQYYQANLKKYISTMRKEANQILQSPQAIQNFSLLPEDQQQAFLEALVRDEPMLIEAVGEFKLKYPSWSTNDIGIFSYVYLKYPDYVLASLSGLPTVAEERKRAVDDRFLQRVHESLVLREKILQESEPLAINNCDHVKNLADIRKIESDDQRIQIMVRKLLPMFKGKTEDDWIHCRICKQHLICQHEYLMILEKTHPKEKDIVHKKILLNFSDGIFNGKFICGVCGQPIQDLDFDQNPEFDDQGRMMMGNQPITEEMETSLSKEIEKLLDVKDQPFTEKVQLTNIDSDDKKMRLQLLDEMATKVGVSLPLASFERMMSVVNRMIINTADKIDVYTKAIAKAQKENPNALFPNYSQYRNQHLISNCAAALFIEIQAAIPNLLIKSAVTECGDARFDGYPLLQDDSNVGGLSYFSCCIATLLGNKAPWGETTWVKLKKADTKKNSIMKQIVAALQFLLAESEIQILLEKKREYIVKEKGIQGLSGRYAEEIPSDFLPLPVQPTEELMKKASEPLIGDAATPSQRAFAWLLQGYRIARASGIYEPGNPLSEASCCYSAMKNPMGFWAEQGDLPRLTPKQPPMGPRGSMLVLKTHARQAQHLLGEPDPMMMYRLFLRVCFPRKGIDNPRVGLPHEPGYDNKCPYCLFEFPVDPRLPPPELSYSKDKKVQEQFTKEYQTDVQNLYNKEITALQEAGADINKEQFENLLKTSNRNFIIPPAAPKLVATDMQTIDALLGIKTELFTGFSTTMTTVKEELSKLPRVGTDSNAPEVYLAYAAISEKYKQSEQKIESAINTAGLSKENKLLILNAWEQLLNASPQILGELLRTFLLLPFQRLGVPEYTPFTITTKNIMKARKAIYSKISREEREVLTKYLKVHMDQVPSLKNILEKAPDAYKQIIQRKIDQLIQRLTIVIPLFTKALRANVVPYGSIGLPYIQKAILSGILWEFIDSTSIGGKDTLRAMLFICLRKSQEKDENTILSRDEVRKIIADRNESEKVKIINEFDRMTPAQKRAELVMKSLGIGRWARAAAVLSYDEQQQMFEAEDRKGRGITDFEGLSAVDQKKKDEELQELSNGFDTYDADGEEEEQY